MPDNNNNVSNENVSAYNWPTDNVITDLKFGANEEYEIGIGKTTQEFLENIFGDIDENFTTLNTEIEGVKTTIEENEETISNALNDLNDRKADKADIPVVPTNVSAFTNDAGYLTQHQDISAYFNDVEYDSNSKRINFKNGATVKKYIDATDFIKDGMVDKVEIKEATIQGVAKNCLVITFNTDSGKEDINIPLSSIFDSNEYYTKEEIDEDGKVIASSLNDLDERKLDASEISNYYTKAESDAKYLTEDSVSDNYYGKDYIDDTEKAIASALNDLDTNKADKSEIPTVPTNVSAFTNDAGYFNNVEIDLATKKINFKDGDVVKKHIDITDIFDTSDYYTKEDIDAADLALTNAINELYEQTETIPQVTNSLIENSTDAVTSGAVYKVIVDNEKAIASSLIDLDERKLDASEMSNYYGKDYIDEFERVTANSLTDLDTNKADKTDIPTNVSSLTNDAGYLVSSDISGKADKTPIVNHGTNDTTFELTPNVYHQWGEVASLTLTLGSAASGYLAEYMFEFTSGSTATTLSLPAAIKWQMPLSVEANKIYQVSIVNNIGIIIGVNS